ncbi:hypothetical protein HAX54_045777 [Datura stramonium]|uniref:DUF1985 domain-containing protein n=1 Tax=Datura stramonium TaxID=4076 RepID=A0ABS8WID8_DATST|nr:hypothetical protein [Datura stramonium]
MELRLKQKKQMINLRKQQDDTLEAKEPYEVDENDSSQEQTESGHASKGNKDGEDDEDGEGDDEDEEDDEDGKGDNENGKGDNEDRKDENNDDDDDTDENTTTTDDKTKEENDENVPSIPAEASSSGRDPRTTSTEIVVQNIRFENYNLKMLMDVHEELEGDIVVRSSMGRGFTEFRKLLRENNLVKFFKSSCFGKFLDLPDDTTPRFQMTMVYSLLRRKIVCDKKDEIWINYCGTPICFGMKEFAVMAGLNCHSPPRVGGAKSANKGEDLFNLVGKSYKKKNLLEHLESKTVPRNVKKSLCLVCNFEPLKSCPDQKIDKLKGDLAGVMAIRRDLAGVEKDDIVSKAINEVVASYAAGDATRIDDDHHSFGGGYTPLDAGGAGDVGGIGDAGGRYTPTADEVRRQEYSPYRLGRSSVVGTSKVPSCACECLKCNENMTMLLSKIEALIEAQGVTEAAINKLISKRGIYSSSRISEPFTPIAVKRRRNQISRALASAKKKTAGTPKMTAGQPTDRIPVNLYKYEDDKKKKKFNR